MYYKIKYLTFTNHKTKIKTIFYIFLLNKILVFLKLDLGRANKREREKTRMNNLF